MKDVHIFPKVLLTQNAMTVDDSEPERVNESLQQKLSPNNAPVRNGHNGQSNGQSNGHGDQSIEMVETRKGCEKSSLRSYSRWSPTDQGATLVWRDVCVYATKDDKNERTIKRLINNVSGAVVPGKLVAMMGASGAGKSTLMAALAYRSARKWTSSLFYPAMTKFFFPFQHARTFRETSWSTASPSDPTCTD
jgi:ABC-type glutathione transport system ATPase component